MPETKTPIRGRDIEINEISSLLNKKSKNKVLVIEGESGIGKTALMASYINNVKKKYNVVIWQPLFDLPTTREIANNWLGIYTETIPDIALNARIDAFFRQLKDNKHKKIMIVFDNVESILQVQNGNFTLPNDFSVLINRLIENKYCEVHIVITSAVNLIMSLDENNTIDSIKLPKLDSAILQKIIIDRTSRRINIDDFSIARGNPSAALLFAHISNDPSTQTEMTIPSGYQSFTSLVDRRMRLLSDNHYLLPSLLSVVRFPMTISEMQNLWNIMSGYSLLSSDDINELKNVYLFEEVFENRFLINPIVATVITNQIVEDLAKVISGQIINQENVLYKLPLDYPKWPKIARNNTNRHIFPLAVKCLLKKYNCSIADVEPNIILERIANKDKESINYLSSNIISFLLSCGIRFDEVIFPEMSIIGVDFSQVHMFNTDLSMTNIINCDFADRVGSICSVCFCGNDKLIVGLASGSLELRNVKDLLRITRNEAHSEPVRALYHSIKDGKIVSGGEDGRIVIYNEMLEIQKSIQMHSRWVWRIVPIAKHTIMTIACDGSVGIINLNDNSVLGKVSVPTQRMWDAVIRRGKIFLASENGILWECSIDEITKILEPKWEVAANLQEPIKACCVCGDKIVLGCRDGKLYLLDSNNNLSLLANEKGCIRDICSVPNTDKFVTIGDSGVAHIYNVTEKKSKGELQVQTSRTWGIDILQSGIAATVGEDRTIHPWDVNKEISLKICSGNGQSLRGVDIYNKEYIFACADDFLRISYANEIRPWKTLRARKRILGRVHTT